MRKLLSALLAVLLSASLALAIPLAQLPNPDNYRLLETAEKNIQGSDGSIVSLQFSIMVRMDGQHMIGVGYYKGQIFLFDMDVQDPDAPVLVDQGFCPAPDGSFPLDGVFTGEFDTFAKCPKALETR